MNDMQSEAHTNFLRDLRVQPLDSAFEDVL